ncbi:hypothetical protein IIY67_03055 [Candidatus Saccharibacteria bacterium]|nr:hypothetical protein [Candidatus Saccharibacteria bacterium]
MHKQGGKKSNYITINQTIFIFMIVLNVIVLMLSLILLGMQLIRREENQRYAEQGSYIEEMLPLNYKELGSFGFQGESNSFMPAAVSATDQFSYQVITSQTELSSLLDKIQRQNANGGTSLEFGRSVSDKFFETGCVIAVTYQDTGLEKFSIGKINRDEQGAIDIIAEVSTNPDAEGVFGKFVLLQIDNIRAKEVKLNLGTD